MGISTVSGPFRSKNGFQELVNGEWVPVAGGGGGGGVTPIMLTPDNVYGARGVEPTGSVLQAPQVAPGEIIRVVGDFSSMVFASETVPRPVWSVQLYGPEGSFINISTSLIATEPVSFPEPVYYRDLATLQFFDPGLDPIPGRIYPWYGEGGGGEGAFYFIVFDIIFLGSIIYEGIDIWAYSITNVLTNGSGPAPNIFRYPT